MYVSIILDVSVAFAVVLFGCSKSRSGDVAHVAYVVSVSEACCKRLFKLFHLFLDICCKHFDLDVVYVFFEQTEGRDSPPTIYFKLHSVKAEWLVALQDRR
jgi:hypothetical protein